MDKCRTCGKPITDSENYNGWCKVHFDIENNLYKRFCLRQDGIDDNMVSDSELSLIAE